MEDETQESLENRYSKVPPQLKKYIFKAGNNANPGGRPKGSKSMKQWAREYLESMAEEDRVAFMNSLDHKTIWEMSEGKPKQDMEIDATITGPSLIRLDE